MVEEPFGSFHRIELLLGRERAERIRSSYVLLAGLGAVGGFALEALCRAGVGRFRLADCDVITPSNINRQILADHRTVGRKKTDVAVERLRLISPECRVETFDRLINAESMPELFTFDGRPCDLMIDAIDSLAPKVELLLTAQERKIPILSSMGAALRTDAERIHFGPLTDVTNCRLSAFVRKRLRRRGGSTDSVLCVWSDEPMPENLHRPDGPMLPPESSEDDVRLHGRRRSTLGSLPTVTGLFGLRLAHEALRILANAPDSSERKI